MEQTRAVIRLEMQSVPGNGPGRLSRTCSPYGNLMHLVESNCRPSGFIGTLQTCRVMDWPGKTLTKIKNNPRSGCVVGITGIRANAALQVLVCSSQVISAAGVDSLLYGVCR